MSKLGFSCSQNVRRQVPSMVVIQSPSETVVNGRNRRKFPSSKDCCVKIAMSDYAGSKHRVPVRYDSRNKSMINDSLINERAYLLRVCNITRHSTNEQLPDLPMHMVCQHEPLNAVKDSEPGHYGFWFRFFGMSCRFHITITLTLHNPGCADAVVNSITVDITNIERTMSINRNISRKETSSKSRNSPLYSNKEYINIMEKLQALQEQCLWEKCISVGEEMLCGLEKRKSDLKVCILLEQSRALCHQGKFVVAKLLVKQGLEAIPTKSANKDLLIARAYTYLSLCHHCDLLLGNAEECLRIAKEKLLDFQPCVDTAELHYNEARLLISFLLKFPNFNKGLVNEAKSKLEKAISHFQESCSFKHAKHITSNKIYNAQLCIAILLALANWDSDSVVVTEKILFTMSGLSLCLEANCRLSFVKALIQQHECANEAAITSAKHALDLAKMYGLRVEKQLIETCFKSLKYI